MTRRLVDAGHEVVGYDAVPGRPEAAGAAAAVAVADVAATADVVLLSLPDSSVVEAVVLGEDGVAARCHPGQIVVDLSTSAPRSTRQIHGVLEDRGVEYLDAGISGGAAAAEKGTLTVMVGGSEKALGAIDWVLQPLASHVVHMGPSGAGHTSKLLNNFLNAVSLAATAEVMVAAKKAGLDLELFLSVLNTSTGVNFATQNRFPAIVRGDYLEGGLTSGLMVKDIVLYIDHLRELGVASLNASGPMASFGLAMNLGYTDQISNRVVDAIGDVSGGVRLFDPHTLSQLEQEASSP